MKKNCSSKKTEQQTGWLKMSFEAPARIVEAASDLLGVLSGSGVELCPLNEESVRITGFFALADNPAELHAHVSHEVAQLFTLFALPAPAVTVEELADEDWATSWRRHFHPLEIVPRLWITPSWESFCPPSGHAMIEMDPGQAFGTGQHASTVLALVLLQKVLQQTSVASALDVGTGTGILAMAAARFGVPRITAIDNDLQAVTVARDNINANRLNAFISTSSCPLDKIMATFPLIMANIIHDVLMELRPQLTRLSSTGTLMIFSGILRGRQEDNIMTAYDKEGFTTLEQEYQEEWAALLVQRR